MSWNRLDSVVCRTLLHSVFPVLAAFCVCVSAGVATADTASVGVNAFIISPDERVAVEDCLQGVGQNCDLVIVRVGAETVCDARAMCDLRGGKTMSFRAYQAQFEARQAL